MGKHSVCVAREVASEGSLICRVQVLLDEAGRIDLFIAGLVQYLDRTSTGLLDCLQLFDEVAALLFASLQMAYRLLKNR